MPHSPHSPPPWTVWTPWTSLGGDLVSAPVPYESARGRLGLVAVGAQGALHARWAEDGQDWSVLGDTRGATCRPETVRGADGRVRVLFNTTSGALCGVGQVAVGWGSPRTESGWGSPRTESGGGWSGQWETPAHRVQRAPCAVLDARGRIVICYRGASDGHAHLVADTGEGSAGVDIYGAPVDLGPSAALPSAALDGSGRLVVTVHRGDRLCVRHEVSPGSGAFAAPLPVAAGVAPMEALAVTDATGRVHLFYRDPANVLWGISQDVTCLSWREPVCLGEVALAQPSARLGMDGRLNVVLHGEDHTARLTVQRALGSAGFVTPFLSMGGEIAAKAPAVMLGRHGDGRLAMARRDDSGTVHLCTQV